MNIDRIRAIYPPFDFADGSTCGKHKPKNFKWTSEGCQVEVFIDFGMSAVPAFDKQMANRALGAGVPDYPCERTAGTYRFGWLCESKAVVADMYRSLCNNYEQYLECFDAIFTCDEHLLSLHPRFRYTFSGSNIPWTPQFDWEIYPKSKSCSMLASPKQWTVGHKLRHQWAQKLKDQIDIFGGVGGTERVGMDETHTHPPKWKALKDYRFSIAIENLDYNNYFTEKLTDCFAHGTIPVYWGCPNIGKYFNTDGIIMLDDSFDVSTLTEELYLNKIDAVKDNFERIKRMKNSDDILHESICQFIEER
tara:strand:+ start:1284 stop:2201 length:918 start_codon:yes stop_codon:yes gene_type:complete